MRTNRAKYAASQYVCLNYDGGYNASYVCVPIGKPDFVRSFNINEVQKAYRNKSSRGKPLSKKHIGEEVRRRFPRLIMSLVMALIFWIISTVVPPTISDLFIPGLNVSAGTIVGFIALLLTAIFLIRALSDALVLSDIVADVVVRQLGIKEETSPRRAARDAIYVIAIILVATALYPLLGTLGEIGNTLTTVTTYVALGIILVLIYDIGKIVYRVIERRAESVADRLAKMTERNRNRE
ncbi:MAG: hypothetical protein JSV75_06160 [Candidatus Bathyarchaeota archaeon]|nr:MAG: hypothetical protein JSV75_06160 [Candidatus Bathyarchaeota archaeon]